MQQGLTAMLKLSSLPIVDSNSQVCFLYIGCDSAFMHCGDIQSGHKVTYMRAPTLHHLYSQRPPQIFHMASKEFLQEPKQRPT